MTPTGRDAPHTPLRPSTPRRWLAGAFALAIALLAVVWVAQQGDADAPAATATRDEPQDHLAPTSFAPTDARDAPHTEARLTEISPSTPDPAPLLARGATLIVRGDEAGVPVSEAFLHVARPADGWWDIRSMQHPLETTWSSLPGGVYTFETLGDAWLVAERSVTLGPRETRTVALRGARSAHVRVVGARSGRPSDVLQARVKARFSPEGTVMEYVGSTAVVPDEGRFTLLGIPGMTRGGPVTELRVEVDVAPGVPAGSDWLPVAAVAGDFEILIRAPEPTIVGHVRREAAPPAGETHMTVPISVHVVRADAPLPTWPLPRDPFGPPDGPITDEAVLASAGVRPDGSYALLLAELPAEPVRVLALDALDAPAATGPFIISPSEDLLRVDLVLPAGGVVHGVVRLPVATASSGALVPRLVLEAASARRAQEPDAARRERWASVADEELVDPEDGTVSREFTIVGLASGDYDIRVSLNRPDGVPDSQLARVLVQRVTVTAGSTTELLLRADEPESGVSVRGSLQLPARLAGVTGQALISPDDGRSGLDDVLSIAETDADGRFVLTGIPPGSWIVTGLVRSRDESVQAIDQMQVRVERDDVDLPPLDISRPELRVTAQEWLPLTIEPEVPFVRGLRLVTSEGKLARLFGLPPGHHRVVGLGLPAVEFDILPGDTVVDIVVP